MFKNFVSIFLCLTIFGVVALSQVSAKKVNVIDIYRKEVFEYAVLKNQKPVVVYFTKKICAPCEGVLNNLKELAQENNSNMYLAIVDLDKLPELEEYFDISKIPTTRTFYKGSMLDEVKGPVWPRIKSIANEILKIK